MLTAGKPLVLHGLIFLMAALYGSVGHGGASGYLASMSFFAFPAAMMATTALILNLCVSGISFCQYQRAGHFIPSLAIPFLVASVPMAFLGGLIPLSDKLYYTVLAIVLFWMAWQMVCPSFNNKLYGDVESVPINRKQAIPIAAVIGLISGMIGVGGGIFLSPLMILFRWASTKQAAAVAACFIWVNSLAGLMGRAVSGKIFVTGDLYALLAVAFIGGSVGSYLGARLCSVQTLRCILALVIFMAAIKLLFK